MLGLLAAHALGDRRRGAGIAAASDRRPNRLGLAQLTLLPLHQRKFLPGHIEPLLEVAPVACIALRIPLGEPLGDTGHGSLELGERGRVGAEEDDAQRAELLRDLVLQHPQRTGRLARDQHPLPRGQQMTDEVGDRLTLASARRSLHQKTLSLCEALGDLELLVVGGEREVRLLSTLLSRAAALGGLRARARNVVDMGHEPLDVERERAAGLELLDDRLQRAEDSPERPSPQDQSRCVMNRRRLGDVRRGHERLEEAGVGIERSGEEAQRWQRLLLLPDGVADLVELLLECGLESLGRSLAGLQELELESWPSPLWGAGATQRENALPGIELQRGLNGGDVPPYELTARRLPRQET